MNDNRIVRSLVEDFAQIGFAGSARDLNRMASQRLEESLYSVPAVNVDSDAVDPIDGPVVTMELFNRIADLDFDSLSEDDCDDLLSGLADKDLPSGDAELAEAAEAVVKALVETRISRRRMKGSRRMQRTQRTTSTEKMKSKKYRRSAGGKKAARIKARKTAAGKLTTAQKASARITGVGRTGIVAAAKSRLGRGSKSKAAPIAADAVSDGLAVELESMLGEQVSTQFGDYGETVSRIARVLSLIEEILGEEVGDVLESAYEKMETSLLTESVDPVNAFKPTLKVIARCLEEIDGLGND